MCTPPPLTITIKTSQAVLKSSETCEKILWTELSINSLRGAVGLLHPLNYKGRVIITADFINSGKYKPDFL